jgi:ubiquinone/menaquinone biosynthesis C-methylase UbiE
MDNFEISVNRFDEFASEYAHRFMNIDSYQKHFDKFCDLLHTKEPKILELGCGPANVTRFLKQKFPVSKIIAIDLAPRMIDIARQKVTDVDFRVMDVRNIKMLEFQFDSIMCSFCLPFLSKSDTDKLISDCSDKLNPNGVLYLSTMEGDASKAGFESTSFSGESKVYFNYHLQSDIEKSLVNSGFLIEYSTRQDYKESDWSITIDLILIARKK